ncbi:MAG: hypothetical protein MUF50_04370 [Planctomycetes bacterium]|jgi:hypothetical protein|nr:hypothetical protein [Planctomycetota bacterium]
MKKTTVLILFLLLFFSFSALGCAKKKSTDSLVANNPAIINNQIDKTNTINQDGQTQVNSSLVNTPLESIDEHGCVNSSGYFWCELKNKCLNSGEEKCEKDYAPDSIKIEGDKNIYTSPKLGLKLSYPKEWSSYSAGQEMVITNNNLEGATNNSATDKIKIEVIVLNNIKTSLDDWLKEMNTDSNKMISSSNFKINGHIAKKVLWQVDDIIGNNDRTLGIYYKEEDKIFIFIISPYNSNKLKEAEEIIKSFKPVE